MRLVGVADGDNFFASCEQLLNPSLRNKPVVVLSSNDGNAISRSKEAKLLGITMGVPRHKIAPLINAGVVVAQSGNWATYDVLSRRLEWSLAHFTPLYEPYSCDELFLDLAHIPVDSAEAYATIIKQTVTKWTGMPISIGVGPTKTLAKAAIERAKKMDGVYVVTTESAIDELLSWLPVEDIWGIGAKKAAFLKKHGITTAKAFRDAPFWWVKQHLSVVSALTLVELQGIQAFPLITERATKQEILVNRAFGHPVAEYQQVQEALSFYTARACEKLRGEHCHTSLISVFIATNPFRKHEPQYANSISLKLPRPTAYTPTILAAALRGLACIYQPFALHRVGIRLGSLTADALEQGTIFAPNYPSPKERQLMLTMDAINQRFGRETIRFLGAGIARPWGSKQGHRSNCALTRWNEIPIVRVR